MSTATTTISFKPLRPYKLQKVESVSSFEAWKHNQLYNLKADQVYKAFLAKYPTWRKAGVAHRGFTDDADGENRQTAAEKCETLNMMLDGIATWCPHISRSFLVKQTTSLNDVWQKIREHYGFLSTGGHFLDLSAIRLEPDERHEDLYQKIYMFFEDNLVASGTLTHHGDALTADEEMTPTVENTITWVWLKLIHPGLPQLVHQRYGAELRNKTLASIKTEISTALSSLLEELSSIEESRVHRTGGRSSFQQNRPNSSRNPTRGGSRNQSRKSCTLCKAAGRTHNTHWMSACTFLPESDRVALSRATNCEDDEFEENDDEQQDRCNRSIGESDPFIDDEPTARRVKNMASPILDVLHGSGKKMDVTVDSGSTSNMIREDIVRKHGITIYPCKQKAGQADIQLTNGVCLREGVCVCVCVGVHPVLASSAS